MIRDCISYAEGADFPEITREYLQHVADGVPGTDCVRLAQEKFPKDVPFHKRTDLLRTCQLRFSAEVFRRFELLGHEVELLVNAIRVHSECSGAAQRAAGG